MHDAPLDMRMNPDSRLTARDIVNGYSRDALKRIITDYGEERFAGRVADRICEARESKPIETTGELSELIKIRDSGKSARGRTSSGQAHLSGDPNRSQLGAVGN